MPLGLENDGLVDLAELEPEVDVTRRRTAFRGKVAAAAGTTVAARGIEQHRAHQPPVYPSEVDGTISVDEHEHVVVAAEVQAFAALVLEPVAQLAREVEVVPDAAQGLAAKATYIAEKKKDLSMDMINIIRENTHKMESQLELLQKSNVDPRHYNGFIEAQ